MAAAGVPIVPGVTDPVPDVAAARPIAEEIGYPVAVKAAAGGAARASGWRWPPPGSRTPSRAPGARASASSPTGRSTWRRYLPEPRRRDPGPRRRPRPLRLARRARLARSSAATRSWSRRRQASRRRGAAGPDGRGVGARRPGGRLHVGRNPRVPGLGRRVLLPRDEHAHPGGAHRHRGRPGLDLVREQVRVAAGEPLSVAQDEIAPRGHAFECRINAEDASARFLPSPARITAYREPAGARRPRRLSGVRASSEIPEIYDPMIAKLIAWDADRESARRRMLRALDEYVVEGPATLIPFHRPAGAGGVHRRRRVPRPARAHVRGPRRSRREAGRPRPATRPRRGGPRPSAASPPRWTGAASR